MAAHTEVELKLLLSAEDHDALRALLQTRAAPRRLTQHNYYLDSSDRLLLRRQVMLRVRVSEDRVVATCKADARLERGVMRVGEWEATLDAGAAAPWLRQPPASLRLSDLPVQAQVRQALAAHGQAAPDDLRLFIVAPMRNERLVFDLPAEALQLCPPLASDAQVRLELDHTLFPACEERHELEVEHPRAAELLEPLSDWLTRADIQWRPATESKYAQLLRLLSEEPALD